MIEKNIEKLWQDRKKLHENFTKLDEAKRLSQELLAKLDEGSIRVCHKENGSWHVNEWVKQGILLYFMCNDMQVMDAESNNPYYDKIPTKTKGWKEKNFMDAGFRMAAGAVIRKGACVRPKCVIMPSYINIGAHVDSGTLIDTWSTIGSCAQIGRDCHISGGVGIGGVLEPINAKPVIIEDNVFIGARSEVAEGVIVKRGAVISMGVYLGSSTKIYDRATGEFTYGTVPENSVVVPGSIPQNGVNLYAAVIVKKVDESTRSKTMINDILRDVV